VTCGDAGVILRGTVEDQKQAGPAKDAAIARTCRLEKWSAEVLQCVGSRALARPCLDKLTPEQREAYNQSLTAWNEAYPDEYLEETMGAADFGLDDFVDCGDAIHDEASYAPSLMLAGDDRTFAIETRRHALLTLCEDWTNEQRACFRDAPSTGSDACRATLEPVQAKAVTDKLAELDRIAAKLAAQQKTPAAFDCKKVVAVHYADAAWKDTMPAVKGAERAKAIAESRAKMTKACTDDKWPPSMRACIAGGGGEPCFTSATYASWRFPAIGVFVKSGIAECDAYAEAVKAVAVCPAMPQSTRDMLQRSWERLGGNPAGVAPEQKQAMADACRRSDLALRRLITSAGCKI
jgi:hypothetical protein